MFIHTDESCVYSLCLGFIWGWEPIIYIYKLLFTAGQINTVIKYLTDIFKAQEDL